jgi:hypothetical protein
MSLILDIINKPQGEKIVPDNELTILIDENISIIKEKLFAMTSGLEWYPKFIKIETESLNSQFEVIKTNKSLLSYFNKQDTNKIYVTNLLQVIEDEVSISEVYINTELFSDLYSKLVDDYTDLRENDLQFIIDLKMLESDVELYSHLKDSVESYIVSSMQEKEILQNKYNEIERGLEKFYNLCKKVKDYSNYIDTDETGNMYINYDNISFVFRSYNTQTGIEGKFIKLGQIFNVIELSDKIPFVAFKDIKKPEPIVKIDNRLLDYTTEKEVKSWILNEKKKLGILTYKKVRGLLIKYKTETNHFININLMDNGSIYAKINLKNEYQLENIINSVKNAVDEIINTINQLQGVFKYSRRLENTDSLKLEIESITGSTETKTLINKNLLSSVLNNEIIRANLFELKDTISPDIVSMYYKKAIFTSIDSEEDEMKGITINIQDNSYKINSSLITIYSAESLEQINVITKQLILISQMESQFFVLPEKQKIKEKSHIKELRRKGVKILSTKCQKPRQPLVNNDSLRPLEGSYVLNYEGKKYVCDKPDYPYPGFTNENIVCCFKKDQRRRDTYIRNMKSEDLDIQVSPSNFKITIVDPKTNEQFETFAIKILASYMDGLDETNSVSRYHYLSNTNELVEIKNSELIERLKMEEENNIWLDGVPLTKILTMPPKNKCNYPPNINNKRNDDINAPCSEYENNKYFGYNLNSFPCCFDKERDIQFTRRKKITDITKQHILISDKILEYQRIGILPSGINKLFNDLIKHDKSGNFYRMGVVQNNSAFLNAILLSLSNKINGVQVNNSSEFKKYIMNYFSDESNVILFNKLNGGNLALKFGTLSAYTNMLLNTNTIIYWNDFVDIIQRIAKVNILILEIPYIFSESSKIADYENTKILCNPNVTFDLNNPFVILLKRMNTFEVVIYMKEKEAEINYQYSFKKDTEFTDNIVNYLVNYYLVSCVREDTFPDNFPYIEMFTIQELQLVLSETPYELVGQLINKFNKIDYAITKKGILLPVKESGILNNLKVFNYNEFSSKDKLLPIEKYVYALPQINTILEKRKHQNKQIKIIGISVETRETEQKEKQTVMTALMTNYGQFIPIKNEDLNKSNTFGLPILDYKFYYDINDKLHKNGNVNKENEQVLYSLKMKQLKDTIFKVKTILANEISKNKKQQQQIINIIEKTDINRITKINNIVEIFNNYSEKIRDLVQIDSQLEKFIYNQIANEVINDNVEKLLLNNLVIYEIFDPTEIIKRDTESVLTSIDEIRKWIKRNTKNE